MFKTNSKNRRQTTNEYLNVVYFFFYIICAALKRRYYLQISSQMATAGVQRFAAHVQFLPS